MHDISYRALTRTVQCLFKTFLVHRDCKMEEPLTEEDAARGCAAAVGGQGSPVVPPKLPGVGRLDFVTRELKGWCKTGLVCGLLQWLVWRSC
jgi:hypothetical protein